MVRIISAWSETKIKIGVNSTTGAQDQSIFVFNRDYLDLDIDEVMNVLGVREGEGLTPSVLQGTSLFNVTS